MQVIIPILFFLLVLAIIQPWKKKRVPIAATPPGNMKLVLEEEVPFYQKLDADQKINFEQRASHFLSKVRITGVSTVIEDLDRVLIAASAIIPIFNFPDWEYRNLHEVLVYPDSFDHEYAQEGEGRNILGMVGSGAMNHMMILSQFQLREAFRNKSGKDNTAIHEFVHLVDKTDGDIDGIPESLLDKKYVMPWLQLMQEEIELIKNDQSDINPYAATGQQEFLSVVAEYFFERPDLLEQKHPELYGLLVKIFGKV